MFVCKQFHDYLYGQGAITTELDHFPQSSTSPPPHLPRVSTACFSHSIIKPQANVQARKMHKLQGRPESQEETPRSPSPLFCMKMAYSQRKAGSVCYVLAGSSQCSFSVLSPFSGHRLYANDIAMVSKPLN